MPSGNNTWQRFMYKKSTGDYSRIKKMVWDGVTRLHPAPAFVLEQEVSLSSRCEMIQIQLPKMWVVIPYGIMSLNVVSSKNWQWWKISEYVRIKIQFKVKHTGLWGFLSMPAPAFHLSASLQVWTRSLCMCMWWCPGSQHPTQWMPPEAHRCRCEIFACCGLERLHYAS